jgi:hypothetical protein
MDQWGCSPATSTREMEVDRNYIDADPMKNKTEGDN